MMYVSRIYLSDGFEYTREVTGRGASAEEAKQNCLRQLNPESLVELAEGILIPVTLVATMPAEPPAGCQLVIFERSSHCNGDSYDWRFFALPLGHHEISCRPQGSGEVTYGRPDIVCTLDVTDGHPALVCTTDSNLAVTYPLPEGSMEYVYGRWLPSAGAAYNY